MYYIWRHPPARPSLWRAATCNVRTPLPGPEGVRSWQWTLVALPLDNMIVTSWLKIKSLCINCGAGRTITPSTKATHLIRPPQPCWSGGLIRRGLLYTLHVIFFIECFFEHYMLCINLIFWWLFDSIHADQWQNETHSCTKNRQFFATFDTSLSPFGAHKMVKNQIVHACRMMRNSIAHDRRIATENFGLISWLATGQHYKHAQIKRLTIL